MQVTILKMLFSIFFSGYILDRGPVCDFSLGCKCLGLGQGFLSPQWDARGRRKSPPGTVWSSDRWCQYSPAYKERDKWENNREEDQENEATGEWETLVLVSHRPWAPYTSFLWCVTWGPILCYILLLSALLLHWLMLYGRVVASVSP